MRFMRNAPAHYPMTWGHRGRESVWLCGRGQTQWHCQHLGGARKKRSAAQQRGGDVSREFGVALPNECQQQGENHEGLRNEVIVDALLFCVGERHTQQPLASALWQHGWMAAAPKRLALRATQPGVALRCFGCGCRQN
jgi:hypothetical protein